MIIRQRKTLSVAGTQSPRGHKGCMPHAPYHVPHSQLCGCFSPSSHFGTLGQVCSLIHTSSSSSSSITFTTTKLVHTIWTLTRHGAITCCQRCPTTLSVPSKAQNMAMPGSIKHTHLPTHLNAVNMSKSCWIAVVLAVICLPVFLLLLEADARMAVRAMIKSSKTVRVHIIRKVTMDHGITADPSRQSIVAALACEKSFFLFSS